MNYDIGTTIGDYQIVGVLGSGGMGKVYKVRNIISDRVEAMKVLLPNLDTDRELAERFMREIKVQASLQHPNIASLHTAQRVDNQLLMIMEYVEGSALDSIMRAGRIPLPACVNYVSQVLSALSYAHAHGVVHRDIKPPNMMLTPEGVVKLMDFGIAKISVDHKLTQTGRTVGSLAYMSPEQIKGVEIDGRSDLYSLGISLYEMVTGKRPFEGDSDYSIMAAHLQQQPLPPVQLDPGLPAALNDVIMISIAKDAAQRFQTADAFRAALQSVAKDLGVGAPAFAAAGGTQIFARPAMPPPPPPPVPMATAPAVFTPPPSQYSAPPPPPPPAAATRSNRGLYMVLGSIVTVGILAAAAFYLPKMLKTGASSAPQQVAQTQEPAAPAQTPPPVTAPVETPTPAQQTVQQPVRQPLAEAAPRPVEHRATPAPVYQPPVQQQQAPPPRQPVVEREATPQVRPPAAENNEANSEVQELRHRHMQMHARIDAVDASMRQLEQEQRRMGLGMNGELVARQHRMTFLMETFGTEMKNGNVAAARAALDNAERELDKLEEHFGR
jgi:serine/threonine-protein kinase